jgi:hypothetical protein
MLDRRAYQCRLAPVGASVTEQDASRKALRQTVAGSFVIATLASLAIVNAAHGQIAEPESGTTAAAASAAIEPSEEVAVDDVEGLLAPRQERLRATYDAWQQAPAAEAAAPAMRSAQQVPPSLEMPPQPDDAGGEITLERTQPGALP